MEIRPTGKLTETSKDAKNTFAKFEDKVLQNKGTVNSNFDLGNIFGNFDQKSKKT